MADLFTLVAQTVTLRPYVFLFLLVYLVGGAATIGLRTTLLFVPVGYLTAWLSELSSISSGFPYGWYEYIPATAGRELWVAGVPFFDSLSYVFLAWCSHFTAVTLRSPLVLHRGRVHLLDARPIRSSPGTLLLGGGLMTILDLVIDPVALRGGEWFLGEIYRYRSPGFHFGVPLSNYLGWFFTGFVMVWILSLLDRGRGAFLTDRSRWGWAVPLLLYAAVILFNLAVALSIRAWGPLLSGTVIGGGTLAVIGLTLRRTYRVKRCLSTDGGGLFR